MRFERNKSQPATVFKRYEKKYLMDQAAMQRLLPEIGDHMIPDCFCRHGESYEIRNIYFDTEEYDVIKESLTKPYYKEKLRLRSYGMPKDPQDQVFLEMKKKIDHIVTKRRASLTLAQAEGFLSRGIIPRDASYMTGQVLKEIAYYLSHKKVKPAMGIRYRRMAFYDKENPDFRLTFDQDIRCCSHAREFWSQELWNRELWNREFWSREEGQLLMDEDFVIMEVKVAHAFPRWFTDLLSREGIHMSSFSKYRAACRPADC